MVVLDSSQALRIVFPSFSQLWLRGGGHSSVAGIQRVLLKPISRSSKLYCQTKFNKEKHIPDVNMPNTKCQLYPGFLKKLQQNLLVWECDIVLLLNVM